MKVKLNYLNGLITESELKDIQKELSEVNIDFRFFDDTGKLKACFDFESPLSLFISREIIASGIGYDLVKLAAFRILQIISNKTFLLGRSSGIEEKPSKLNLNAKLADGGEISLTIEGNLDKEAQNNAIDKAFRLLENQTSPTIFYKGGERKDTMIGFYDKKTNQYEVESMSEFVEKKIEEQNKRG